MLLKDKTRKFEVPVEFEFDPPDLGPDTLTAGQARKFGVTFMNAGDTEGLV